MRVDLLIPMMIQIVVRRVYKRLAARAHQPILTGRGVKNEAMKLEDTVQMRARLQDNTHKRRTILDLPFPMTLPLLMKGCVGCVP